MKIETVIDQLKDLIKDRRTLVNDDEDIEWDEIWLRDIKALNQAIELLGRSIKKKPVKTGYGYPCCPKCFCNFYVEDLGQIFKDNYCGICGQALDWSGKDEL